MSQSAPTAGYDGHNLLVIAGTPRSGTTWIQRLLASHPKIRTGQESNLFSQHIGPQLRAWRQLNDPKLRGGLGLGCYFSEDAFLSILKSYLEQLLQPMVGNLAPGEMFLEKTPDNALYLPQIFELLPRARVIHVLRDARDVVSSLTAREAWLSAWAPANAQEAARTWVRYVTAVREAMPGIPAAQFHEIRYEEMSRNPVEELKKTADFLGLDWELADIEKAVELNRADKAKKTGGTPIPVYGDVAKRSGPVVVEPQGFIRKAQSGGWKDDLSLVQKFWVWRIAHRTMDENGYHWSKGAGFAYSRISSLIDVARWGINRCLYGQVRRQAV
ncbi:MAG: sulfotransferase [Terracidiphilus sp.]